MAPLYRHPYYRIRRCRRRSCSCGGGLPLHEQAARAKVARSSAQPEGLRSASRRQSRRSCSASQRTPPRTGATHRQFHGAAPCAVLLHAPAARKRSASAATGACCAVTLRTAPSPLRAAPSAVFPRAPQAPFRVLLRRGREERKERIGCREDQEHGIISASEIKTRPRRVVGVRVPPVSNLPPWLSLLRVALT